MVPDILRTVLRLSKLGKLGSYATLCFGCHKKKAGGEFQKTKRPSKMLHSMQIRVHVVWEYFSTSLVGVVGACEKLRDFFVQYLKF